MDEARAPAEKANPSTSTSTSTGTSNAPPTTTITTTTTTTSSTTPTPTPAPGSIAIAGGSEAQGQGSAPPLRHGHELPFVAPSSYLRPKPTGRDMTTEKKVEKKKAPPLTVLDKEQLQGLRGIREFLKVRTSYDVLPLSFRLVVLDNDLLIRKSLNILIQNSIVSAPLWDSRNSTFAGLLTSTDYINVIQYYCLYPDEINQVDRFRLCQLRDIEKAIGVLPLETSSVHPMRPLYEACRQMLKTRARRIPLIDCDHETGRQMVLSVLTQYRILKFIAVNNEQHTMLLKKPVRELGMGTYGALATATMASTVLDVIHIMVSQNISAVPIVETDGRLLNVFEAVDVIPCIQDGAYDELSSTVGEALSKRADDFPGIYTCTEEDRLDSIFDTIRKARVHRLIVTDDESRLKGIISLSDVLKYVLEYGEEEDMIRDENIQE
ncbi:hypothetical protein B0T18DRAFT_313724 [Schizothecium vesticola]|uniref:CBS domain-containing protein n=1 Tax=Schizothecium vesticola TaxID=314040 RepID=A0AA40FCF0_9PEZI|nr:hypothetical protein B0T18DRAFT_313724 [Schizothecium vesticola]